VIWLGKKIDELIEKELSDEDRIKEKLMELQMEFELEEISEEEYIRQEEELLGRLNDLKNIRDKEVLR
jgi:hypothetical protein